MTNIRDKLLLLCAGGFCGVSPKVGSFLAGVYMILMTNMYLIFEAGYLARASSILERMETGKSALYIIVYCYYAAITLACITYPVCIYFLYSVQKRDTVGLFIYLTWIVFYDIANCTIIAVTARIAKKANFELSPLEWFGLATRIPVDCFWLSFIVTYIMMITEGRRSGRLSLKTRRVSRHVTEPPRFRLGISARRVQ